MANILYGKAGLKIPATIFGKSKFSDGEDDYVRLLINLAYNNPDDTFYLISVNDFDKMSEGNKKTYFPNNNVFNAYNFKKVRDPNERYKIPLDYLNERGIIPEYGIIGIGAILDRNIPNMTKIEGGTYAKPLDRGKNYTAPVWHTLNETGVRWVGLVDDPRCLKMSYDLFNVPEVLLSQIKTEHTFTHIKSYEDQSEIESKVDVVYAYTETTNILDEVVEKVTEDWKFRDRMFDIALNPAGNHEKYIENKNFKDESFEISRFDKINDRYPILKKWVIDTYPECHVYGKWPEEIKERLRMNFKGEVSRSELYIKMKEWKHSLCIPIGAGWATAKYLEYLKRGVSPFLHPNYDTQKNINLQDFYRVETPDELQEKVGKREDDHLEEINKAIKLCLADEYVSGEYLNNEIYHYLGLTREHKLENKKGKEFWRVQVGVQFG